MLESVSVAAKRIIVISAAMVVAGVGISSAALASSGSAASAGAAGVRACTAGDLGAWVAVDQGNGAAGSIYFPLQFTNLSGHACSLRGFPGVSALDRSGHQLGSPANRDHMSTPRTVVLAAGATAHAVFRWSDAAVTTAPGCHPTFSATELRIYPPNQRSATHAAFSLEVCSRPGPIYMSVGPIIPGAGTING
ncbi:MAG TPA: DUF4232 domain-containing protein [Streptosporangiaceae bacterium]